MDTRVFQNPSYCNSLFTSLLEQLEEHLLFDARESLSLCLTAYLVGGHVLFEGPPGTGKTLTAKLLSTFLSQSYRRIQFTSDLLPSDIIGSHIYSPKTSSFEFVPGPLFADIILADELNRTPPRTQSALLEAMDERQVTAEGKRLALSQHFFVVATQNPQDFEGTFPLPEAQLDRFLFKIVLTHKSVQTDAKIIQQTIAGILPPDLSTIVPSAIDWHAVQSELRSIELDSSLVDYIARILEGTRNSQMLTYGTSVRAGVALAQASKAFVALDGRKFVTPDDIKYLAKPVLIHRIQLNSASYAAGQDEDSVISAILDEVSIS